MLKDFVERKIAESSPTAPEIFDTEHFPWVTKIEGEWKTIRGELDAVLLNRRQIPNFQDVSQDQARLTQGDDWKTFFFTFTVTRTRKIVENALKLFAYCGAYRA